MLPDHEINIRVRYYETDAQGFVHHANYFVYFEQARVEQLSALGYDYAHLERDGILLVVNKIACKFHRPSKFGDTLRVAIRTIRARCANRSRVPRLSRQRVAGRGRKHARLHRPTRPRPTFARFFGGTGQELVIAS